jgi:DNA-binding MarR family transcriptional regulator
MSTQDDRAPLLEALHRAFRRHGMAQGLFSQAVAGQLGITVTDLQVLGLLQVEPLTATQIAERTGLTSGAITGLVDRLEKAGFVVRDGDPADRRRVIVRARPERGPEVGALYQPLLAAGDALLAQRSEEDLRTMEAVLTRSAQLLEEQARLLRGGGGEPEAEAESLLSAPLGARQRARLEFRGGAAQLTVAGGAPRRLLYQAAFEGHAPTVRLEGDTVAVSYPRFRLGRDWRGHRGEIALSGAVPWELVLRGGAARVTLRLDEVLVRSVELSGGVSEVSVELPRPEGTGRVRVTGGANQLAISRPDGIPARLHLTGGAARIAFDAQRLGAVGGDTRLETAGYDAAPARWDIEVTGGAAALSVAVR